MDYHQHQKQFFEAREKAHQIKRFRDALINHGIIPFLMTLKRLENEEQYELCQIAIDTIKRANISAKIKYETNLKDEIKTTARHTGKPFKTVLQFIENIQPQADKCYNDLLNKYEIPIYIDHNLCSTNWIHKF